MNNILNKLKNSDTNWKYVLIIVFLAFLAGGTIFGYQWWLKVKSPLSISDSLTITPTHLFNNSKETLDWKTYRNEEYGFEIKYPADFVPHELSHEGVLFRISFWDKDCSIECGSIEISIRDREGKSFQQIKEEVEGIYSSLYSEDITLEETMVNGKRAYIDLGYEFGLGGVTVVGQQYIYRISRWYSSKDVPEKLFNQMLSTFQFIE